MPSNVSTTKLDAQEIYKRNVGSVMLILVEWNAPVTKDDLHELSDEPGKDGSPSLKKKAKDSIDAGHPMVLHNTASGSGVAIFSAKLINTASGEITYYLTNCHVVDVKTTVVPLEYSASHTIRIQNKLRYGVNELPEAAGRFAIKTNVLEQSTSEARLVEAHPDIDVCVIARTEAGFWESFYAGDPISGIRPFSDLKVGERVFAIGNPTPSAKDGPLTWSLTEGIISALRRDEEIQISAAIYHGNSGGGLFDEYGNLIGIPSNGYGNTQGFNFAIAADKIWTKYGK